MMHKKYLKYYNYTEDFFEDCENPIGELHANFTHDIEIYKMVSRIFARYKKTGKINHHLVINHLIVFLRSFKSPFSLEWLYDNIDQDYHLYLQTALHYIGAVKLPEEARKDNNLLKGFEKETPYQLFEWRERIYEQNT